MSEDLQTTLPLTSAAIEKGIELGWHPGAQIAVWHDGEDVVNAAAGESARGVPMRPDSVNLWLSAGKPVAAVAAGILEDRRLLDLDATVASYWPEFGANGKDAITVRHVLTHTGGFRTAESADRLSTRDEVLAAIVAARLETDWVSGEKAGYHATSGWHVLGEVIHRVSGTPYEEFVRTEVFAPLRMDSSTFVFTPETAAALGSRAAVMHITKDGAIEPHPHFTPEVAGAFVRPGGGLRSTASDMVRLYRMFLGLGELDGVKVLEPGTAAEITSPQRVDMKDNTFGHVMDWGLGVMFDNKMHGPAAPYGYGPHASPRTFGHGGRESSTAFADPQYSLAAAITFNGMPGELKHDRRIRMVTAALYEDLGLV